jgi:uncharacterized protein (TIGR02594 family)
MKALLNALKLYGTWEWAGNENNPIILNMFKEIGQSWVKDDETAWCAVFVNYCLKQAGLPQTGKIQARSFLTYGVSTKKPELGDIVVFWRERKDSPFGHVGFYISETPSYIYVLGGNQSDQVNIQRRAKTFVLDYRKIPEIKNA